jgi:hypothetical protein
MERYMKFRGDGANINRYRATKEPDSDVHLYLDVQGEWTVTDLLNAIKTQAPISTDDVTFGGGCFVLTVPSTPEDRENWRRNEEERERRAKQSRREWYERLKAEFEGEE